MEQSIYYVSLGSAISKSMEVGSTIVTHHRRYVIKTRSRSTTGYALYADFKNREPSQPLPKLWTRLHLYWIDNGITCIFGECIEKRLRKWCYAIFFITHVANSVHYYLVSTSLSHIFNAKQSHIRVRYYRFRLMNGLRNATPPPLLIWGILLKPNHIINC